MKPMRRISGWATSAAPLAAPRPLITAHRSGPNTPAASSAMRSPDSGVWSGVLSTTALPATNGAAILPAAKKSGWLNGMIRPTTP
jgi:hypothetical protein